VCPVCLQERSRLLVSEAWAGEWQAACGHAACEECIRGWVDAQISQCRRRRQLRLRCFGPGCSKALPQQLVLAVSAGARDLADRLEQRFDLERNRLYPAPLQVDCPRPDCVGIGYLGFDTVMCFVCEHQWEPDRHLLKKQLSMHGGCGGGDGCLAQAEAELPETVRRCPRCSVPIEKDGGCDHITCRCGYEFRWSTLELWRPL